MRRRIPWLVALVAFAAVACPSVRSPLRRETLLQSVTGAVVSDPAANRRVDLDELLLPLSTSTGGDGPWSLSYPHSEAFIRSPADSGEQAFSKCLVAAALRRVEIASVRCAEVLADHGEHAATKSAALMLRDLQRETETPRLLTEASASQWRAACGGAADCAELARILDTLVAAPIGVAPSIAVDGPLQGPDFITEERLARDNAFRSIPRRTVRRELHARDGRHFPARGDIGGWFRVTLPLTRTKASRLFIEGEGKVAVVHEGGIALRALGGVDGEVVSFDLLTSGATTLSFYHFAPHGGAFIRVSAYTAKGKPAVTFADGAGPRLGSAGQAPHLRVRRVPLIAPADPSGTIALLTAAGRGADIPASALFDILPRAARTVGGTPVGAHFITAALSRLPGLPAAARTRLQAKTLAITHQAWPHSLPVRAQRVRRAIAADLVEEAKREAMAMLDDDEAALWAHALLLEAFRGVADPAAVQSAAQITAADRATSAQLLLAAEAFAAVFDLDRQRQALARAAALPGVSQIDAAVLAAAQGDEDSLTKILRSVAIGGGDRAVEDWRTTRLAFSERDAAELELARRIDTYPNDASRYWALIDLAGRESELGKAIRGRLWSRFPSDVRFLLSGQTVGAGELTAVFARARERTRDAAAAYLASAEAKRNDVAYVYVLDDVNQWYFHDLSSFRQRSLVVGITSEEAVERFGELTFDPLSERVMSVRVWSGDGGVREPEVIPGVEVLAVPGLSPGDVVEIVTVERTQAPRPALPAYQTYTFHAEAPILSRQVEVSWPASLSPRLLATQRVAPPRVQTRKGRTTATWTMPATPAILPEAHAVSAALVLGVGGVAFRDSPQHWAVARGQRFDDDTAPNAFWRALAKEEAGGGGRNEQLLRLFNFVRLSVEPGVERSPLAALFGGRGQRHIVFATLARGLGRSASPVFFEPVVGFAPDEVPTGERYFLAGVVVDDDLDALVTEWQGSFTFGALPRAFQGGRMLDARSEVSAEGGFFAFLGLARARVSDIPDNQIDSSSLDVKLVLREKRDGAFEGTALLQFPVVAAGSLAHRLGALEPAALRAVFETWLAASFPGTKVDDVLVPRPWRAPSPFSVAVTFGVPGGPQGAPLVFPSFLPLSASTTFGLAPDIMSYLEAGTRTRPVHVQGFRDALEVEVQLGPQSTFIATPESYDAEVGPFALRQNVEVTDGRLVLTRELSARPEVVSAQQLTTSTPRLLGVHDARVAPLKVLRSEAQTVQRPAKMEGQ